MSNQDVTLGRCLSLIRWLFGIAACIALALIVATLFSDWNNRRRAEAMLTLAKTLRVGESTVPDVLQAVGILRRTMDVMKGVDEYHMPVEKVSLSACASTDCVFVFEPAPCDKRLGINARHSFAVSRSNIRRYANGCVGTPFL